MRTPSSPAAVVLASLVVALGGVRAEGARETLSLDGQWKIAEGLMDQVPASFDHRVPVPGLVDMAKPGFVVVGARMRVPGREAFWYRRTFRLDGPVPEAARLKISKAAYGSRVFLNGKLLGDHRPSFTPGWFDAREALRGSGAANELIVRVGAYRESVPAEIPSGSDFEKTRYIPGIFDSVELVLSGSPHVVRVQCVPDITNESVRVQAVIRHTGPQVVKRMNFTVREAGTGKVVGTKQSEVLAFLGGEERLADAVIPLRTCHLWSPEDPFLYELVADTGNDVLTVRFGMRQFHLDPTTGRAYLNGRPRFLRGSNVTLYRFFEDAERKDRPWREDWVRRLHRRFKEMHWHALRYCIGFPPELWYRIADEEGFLIQDEFPIWGLGKGPESPKADELAREYTEWMQERWNHPCVVIWDAQNETVTEETGKAIAKVRGLDLSNRPWDNGWGPVQAPGDAYESHPYLFSNPNFKLSGLADVLGRPGGNPAPNKGGSAIILNEYGWLWLNRDGTPTTLTREVYANLLGTNATPSDRRRLYARYLAALTEFWRARRACAGVLHFCGLGYSRPDGQTSDHWTDLEQLTYEPEFFRYVREAFAPVGLMIDDWADDLPPGQRREVPVVVISDLYEPWEGQVRFRLLAGDGVAEELTVAHVAEPLGSNRMTFTCTIPAKAGRYQFEAALLKRGAEPVRSLRDFEVLSPEQRQSRYGIAVGKSVQASSSTTKDGVQYPAQNAVDGNSSTRWSSDFSDPQWLAVDLGDTVTVSRVELLWEAAFATSYAIQVSADGQTWKDVYATDKGGGKAEVIRFAPTPARWIRFRGTKRATPFGYSLWEVRVFP
jgi:beta-galactosidase